MAGQNPFLCFLLATQHRDTEIRTESMPPLAVHERLVANCSNVTSCSPPSYAGFSWRSDFQSPLAELPDLVVPVGQYPYESRITKTVEHLPVSIAIISAQGEFYRGAAFLMRQTNFMLGTDLKLLAVMEDFLVHSGKSTVKTGRYPFDVHAKGPGLKHQL